MEFGRVQGFISLDHGDPDRFRLRVILERAKDIELIRDEIVVSLAQNDTIADLSWQADQYTQETIGVDLAIAGWELIGEGEAAEPAGVAEGIGQSRTYLVRRF